MGRVPSWPDMKPRNSAIVHYLNFLAIWWEWEEQKLYLRNSLPATSFPLRKYPNLSVARVLCWWGYHQMLFSGGKSKHRDAEQSAELNFWGFIMKKKDEIWKILRLDPKTWHSWLAEPWLEANSFLNEHLNAPWCWHDICGDVLTEKAGSHGKAGAQPWIWEESSYKIDS